MLVGKDKRMKKIIALLLAGVLAFSCVACGNENEKNTENTANSETQESEDITSESEQTEKPAPQIDYVSIDDGGTGVVELIWSSVDGNGNLIRNDRSATGENGMRWPYDGICHV